MRRRASNRGQHRRTKGIALVLAILAVGLAASWGLSAWVDRHGDRQAARLMDLYADDESRAVAAEIARYSDTLANMAAAISAQSDFSSGDFAEITSRLSHQSLPGVSGAVFIVPVDQGKQVQVQQYWRARGMAADFRRVGVRPQHAYAVFSRSLDGVATPPGLDVSQADEPMIALRVARDSKDVAASPTYILLKDRALPKAQQQLSFALVAPVFGGIGTPRPGEFEGWILMGMHGGDFLSAVLRAESRGAVSVKLADASEGNPRTVATVRGLAKLDGHLERRRTVMVGQRAWLLTVYSTEGLLPPTERRLPLLTLLVAIVVTVLFTTCIGVLIGARNHAMIEVDRATAALRDDVRRRMAVEETLRDREAELQHLAFHDPLTGLANRTLFYERVEHAIATHQRSQQTLAVLFVDLDGFKEINDSLGHQVGDALLTQVAGLLLQCVRGSDTVARLGGDEFAVLAEQVDTEHAELIANRIVTVLRAEIDLAGHPCNVTASVGVTLCGAGHRAVADLLLSADEAMYAAKAAGKNRYVVAGPVRTST